MEAIPYLINRKLPFFLVVFHLHGVSEIACFCSKVCDTVGIDGQIKTIEQMAMVSA